MRDIDLDYTTHFITHPRSGIQGLEDLRGKSFAFGSRSSVQAGLMAHFHLKRNGLVPGRDFARYTFYEERQPWDGAMRRPWWSW